MGKGKEPAEDAPNKTKAPSTSTQLTKPPSFKKNQVQSRNNPMLNQKENRKPPPKNKK